jgi:hypothetical protein
MVRTKNTARKSTGGWARPRRPQPKPFPKGRLVLENLYQAIKTKDLDLARYILAPKIYGEENLIGAIDYMFEDLNLAGEIFSFLDWKVDNKSLSQHSDLDDQSASHTTWASQNPDVDDTYGTDLPLLFFAIENSPEIAIFLIRYVPEIDINRSRRKRIRAFYAGPTYYSTCAFQNALKFQEFEDHFEVISALLEHPDINIDLCFKHALQGDANMEVISVILLQPNLDPVQAIQNVLQNVKHVDILTMLLDPVYFLQINDWLTENGFQYALENACLIMIQVFVKYVKLLGIDLIETNRSKSELIFKSLFKSEVRTFKKIVYLVKIAEYKVTPEIISLASNTEYSDYDSDPDTTSHLMSYLHNNMALEEPSSKRRKLN